MIVRETGMRIGEVLALQRADVCLEPGREQDGGGSARPREPPNRRGQRGHLAADHPWRKAWSIYCQREIASTA